MFRAALRNGSLATWSTVAVGASLATHESVFASDAQHPADYPYDHKAPLTAFDHASLRRGYQVFAGVCSSCHSLDLVAYRNLVGVTHTETEAKELAEAARPGGKLADYFVNPYENEAAARAANSGALPPDLSLIVKARHSGVDYLFALLTGYRDPPAGIEQKNDALHYNPYFPGGFIGMAQALFDGAVEYDDGTPATQSQMAKDVAVFLNWAAEPEHDERKRMGMKTLVWLGMMIPFALYWKRVAWAGLKTRQIRISKK